MKSSGLPASSASLTLPDFLAPSARLRVAWSLLLAALLLSIAVAPDWRHGGPLAVGLIVELQLLGLAGGAALGYLRPQLLRVRGPAMLAACGGVLGAVIAVLGSLIYLLQPLLARVGVPAPESYAAFIGRQLGVGLPLALALFAYLHERQRWEDYARSESDTRYLALQARIRPHFLFNSLNSIAALIQPQPEKAEELVADLADLFRASLDERSRLAPLAEEVEIVKGYLRIEEARLDNKLLVNWEIPDELAELPIPRLIIQPLVENAIYHGISRLRARGLLSISARLDENDLLVIEVDNPLPPDDVPLKKGTGVAVNNIVQRIRLIYGERATLEMGRAQSELGPYYRARLRLPYQTSSTQHGESP